MSDEYHFACRIADMKPMSCRNRFHSFPARSSEVARAEKRYSSARASANGRDLVVVMINDAEFYAMDERCYHAGGPLDQGDIEDFEGRLCIVCPWHRHRITLDTGESLYHALADPRDPRRSSHLLKSKGVKQRTHRVKRIGDDLFVKLKLDGDDVDSDYYYSDSYEKIMKSVEKN
ncbi:Rieske domain-containing protein-like isoform X2 [Oscarella lobularis]|uniref:Rieske domain-containing protein-like isoform X2 n=1 Tax=Oscarella lobularis TaxID=121494 RepID=UPI0033140B3F